MTVTRHLRASIVSRRDFAPDLWSIRVRIEEPILFKPGQYATLGIEENGRVMERPYSICSSPEEGEVEFFFELVPHGLLTPRLHALGPGDQLLVRPACKGLFCFDTRSGRTKHLMVGTVTGVAPFLSMIRTFARRSEPGHRLYLLIGASRSWEFGYADELRELSRSNPWLEFVPAVSRPREDPAWRGELGRVEDVLRKHTDRFGLSPGDTTAYLCGHPGMIATARGILERQGFEKAGINEEIYFPLKPAEKLAA